MKILIATDGSEYSTAAVDACCRMLLRDDSEVLVVSAYEDAYPITAEPFALSSEYYQKLDEAVRHQTGSFVDEASATLRSANPKANRDHGHVFGQQTQGAPPCAQDTSARDKTQPSAHSKLG